MFGKNIIYPSEILAKRGLRRTPSPDLMSMLTSEGILAKVNTKEVYSEVTIDLDDLIGTGDSDQKIRDELEKSKYKSSRRRLAALTITNILDSDPNATVIYFGPSVEDSKQVASLLLMFGKSACHISAETSRGRREQVIREFKEGKVRVICNCELLTTGFDAPRISHVVIGRPTTSPVLYSQMVGRGIRGKKFGGTDVCEITLIKDNFKRSGIATEEIWEMVGELFLLWKENSNTQAA
ncbi:MAG: helicase-related protein [Bdellovibrionota bacterium]